MPVETVSTNPKWEISDHVRPSLALMDNLTHTLVGVVMARAWPERRWGRGMILTLALASNLPDLDAVLMFTGDNLAFLHRRGVTHSVVGLLPLCAGLAWLLRRWYPRQPFGRLFGLSILAVVVHVLLDLVNSYGIVPLAPFSSWRPELAWMFVIDLQVWTILLVATALPALRFLPPKWREAQRTARVAVVLLAGYVLACAGLHNSAKAIHAAHLRQGARPDFTYVFPAVLGPHRFRGVARYGETYHLVLLHVLTGRVEPVAEFRTDLSDPRVARVRETEEARRLEWFFKAPVWSVEGAHVRVFDLRFRSAVLDRPYVPFVYIFRRNLDGTYRVAAD